MWQVIQYIGTPIALLAFIVAVAAYIYKQKCHREIELIKAAPTEARPPLISALFESYGIRDDNLSRGEKYELVKTVIKEKAKRFKIIAFVSIIIALILASVIIAIALDTRSSGLAPNYEKLGHQYNLPSPQPNIELKIIKPISDQLVDRNSTVVWETPFSGWYHYVTVTPLNTGTPSIQATTLVNDRTWSEPVRIGEAATKPGQEFRLQVFATNSKLAPTSLENAIPDIKFSPPIVVRLKQ